MTRMWPGAAPADWVARSTRDAVVARCWSRVRIITRVPRLDSLKLGGSSSRLILRVLGFSSSDREGRTIRCSLGMLIPAWLTGSRSWMGVWNPEITAGVWGGGALGDQRQV